MQPKWKQSYCAQLFIRIGLVNECVWTFVKHTVSHHIHLESDFTHSQCSTLTQCSALASKYDHITAMRVLPKRRSVWSTENGFDSGTHNICDTLEVCTYEWDGVAYARKLASTYLECIGQFLFSLLRRMSEANWKFVGLDHRMHFFRYFCMVSALCRIRVGTHTPSIEAVLVYESAYHIYSLTHSALVEQYT